MSAVNNYYYPQEYFVNQNNVSKIIFYPRRKCDWFKWCDERYVKESWFSKKKIKVRDSGFYDIRLNNFAPEKTYDYFHDKIVYKLKDLKNPEINPYWAKFDGEYSENYIDTEIFIRPYVEITYNDGTIDRYWFWTDEELYNAKEKFFDLNTCRKLN